MTADAAAAAPQDSPATKPTPEAPRPKLTVKQRDRVDEIRHAQEVVQEAFSAAVTDIAAWERKERRALDDGMSSRVNVAAREQTAAVATAVSAKAKAIKQIDVDYRKAISAADSARVKARHAADADVAAVRAEAQRLFAEASAPVEAWYKGEQVRIAEEIRTKLGAVEAVRSSTLGPLQAELDTIDRAAKKKLAAEKTAATTASEGESPAKEG